MPWVRFNLRPQDVAQQLGAVDLQVCYVIERDSALDEAVLQRACARAKLPRPGKQLLAGGRKLGDSLLPLARKVGVWRTRLDRRTPALLQRLLEETRRDPAFDVLLVPVSVYFGRSPQRESGSWLRLMLSEDWALASRIRRLLAVMLNGRNTLVEFGNGVPLRSLLSNDASINLASRRISRHLRAQLAASRAAYIGPDLSHRRTLMTQVLRTRAVRTLVAQQARERGMPRRKALEEAQAIFEEIAADYSPAFVQLMERVLKRLWTRIFDGVDVLHGKTLAEVAAGNELVYVPCHRSTMDDLLMPYAIYTHGFCDSAHRCRREPRPAGGGAAAAQGRRLLHASQLPRQCAVHSRVHELSRCDDGARPSAAVFHRGRPQPHRPPAVSEDGHALDDAAQLCAPAREACGVRSRLSRLRAHHRGRQLLQRAVGQGEGEGDAVGVPSLAQAAARKLRSRAREYRGTDPSHAAARCDAARVARTHGSGRARRDRVGRRWMRWRRASCATSTPRRR